MSYTHIIDAWTVLLEAPFSGYTYQSLRDMPVYRLMELYDRYRVFACPENISENYEKHKEILKNRPKNHKSNFHVKARLK